MSPSEKFSRAHRTPHTTPTPHVAPPSSAGGREKRRSSPKRAGRDPRSFDRRALAALLAALVLGTAMLSLGAPTVSAQETTTPEGSQNESWDRDDPACVGAQPRSAQEAEELSKECMKTPEEKEQDAQERQAAEEGGDTNGQDESGMNGVPAGYKRNAGPGDAASPTEEQSDSADENYDTTQDAMTEPGGFTGLAVSAFQGILEWLYGVTVEAPSKEISRVLTEEAFQMPDLDAEGIGGFYDDVSDAVKPGAVLVMLYVGYLMMYQGASYNANVAVQNVLPKIFVFFAMIGFLPDLLKMLTDLTSALSETFVNQDGLEAFLSGQGSAGSHAGDDRAFMFVLGHAAALVMMILVLFVCGIKNIVYTQLYVLGPLAMLAWAVPQLSDLAASWARAMIACILLPLVFAAEFAIGAVMINNPGSVFGEGFGNDTTFTALLITIVVFYVVWRTPKHMLSWALSGHSASPGMVSSIVKSVVVKRFR